jgi:hypothetical protein
MMFHDCNGRPLKRNQVVGEAQASYVLFGRINRILPNGLIEVVDCGRYYSLYEPHELEAHDYKGCHDFYKPERFNWMPSLRRLKQMAARYDKAVWKKHRPKGVLTTAHRSKSS